MITRLNGEPPQSNTIYGKLRAKFIKQSSNTKITGNLYDFMYSK